MKSSRRIISLCIIAGAGTGTLVAWMTGALAWLSTTATRLWGELAAWLQSPCGLDRIIGTAAAVLGLVLLILILVAVISDE